MKAEELFREGRLREAIEAAGAAVRDSPRDERLRTFLFELLCFAGEWDRADKHIELLGGLTKDRQMGALFLRAAVQCARTRDEMFASGEVEVSAPDDEAPAGELNGSPFTSIRDADPRIGARLEVFASGHYLMLPFTGISEITMAAPRRARDLVWAPARLQSAPDYGGGIEMGEVLLPAIAPLSGGHPDDEIRLGRASVWESDGEKEYLFGQKLLLVDGEEFPFLEIRSLKISGASPNAHAAA